MAARKLETKQAFRQALNGGSPMVIDQANSQGCSVSPVLPDQLALPIMGPAHGPTTSAGRGTRMGLIR